ALAGTRTDLVTRAFMGWFGPKGVATMAFALLLLSRDIEQGARIANIAALAVLISIFAHGATDLAGSEWIARRAEEKEARAEAAPAATAAASKDRVGLDQHAITASGTEYVVARLE